MGLVRVSRRSVLVAGGAGAVAFGVTLPWTKPWLKGLKRQAKQMLAEFDPPSPGPDVFLSLDPDGTLHFVCHRSEMGQQTWTAMAQIIADELEADWDRVVIHQADGDPKYGGQNTDGSTSVRDHMHPLREAGAAMRTMLVRAAAERWDVPPGTCTAALHEVVHAPSGRRLSYGELADSVAEQPIPSRRELELKPRSTWRYMGKPMASRTTPQIVRGEGTFGIDVQVDGMVHAVIARPPRIEDTIARVDDRKALEVPGVLAVHRLDINTAPMGVRPLGGVAVIAEDTWSAIQGRRALDIEWSSGPHAGVNESDLRARLAEAANQPGRPRRERGDVTSALAQAERTHAAEYFVPHLAQTPMEPPSATARWLGDEVECWACTQSPEGAREEVARACGIPTEAVTVHVTWLGGGFGRKSKPDFVVEAALLARTEGRPVKVVWTREDDVQHGFYHSASHQRLEAALSADGTCTALLHRSVFPSIGSTFDADNDGPSAGELSLGASDTPFVTANLRLESAQGPNHVRIGWMRAVCNVFHAFAVQSFAAELAHLAGRDPKDYLLDLIGPPRRVDPTKEGAEYGNYGASLGDHPIDTGRMAHVVRQAAEMADWGRALKPGRGLGIAAHRSFLSYVATVIEVDVAEDGRLHIPHVWSAIDAGTVINPEHTRAQVEGGTIYGLSSALYGQITLEDGRVKERNFPEWRVMRMSESPRAIEVHIVESTEPPGGVGEPPTPPAAPALANAIFAATGRRFRSLPIIGPGADRLTLAPAAS